MSMDAVKFQCSFCGLQYISFGQLARHVRAYHENVPFFSISCVVRGCENSYKSVSSLKKHMQSCHSHLMSVSACGASQADTGESSGVNHVNFLDGLDNSDAESQSECNDNERCSCVADMLNHFHEKFTLLTLRVKEVHILPATVQYEISNSACDMMTDCLSNYKDIICQQLSNSGS